MSPEFFALTGAIRRPTVVQLDLERPFAGPFEVMVDGDVNRVVAAGICPHPRAEVTVILDKAGSIAVLTPGDDPPRVIGVRRSAARSEPVELLVRGVAKRHALDAHEVGGLLAAEPDDIVDTDNVRIADQTVTADVGTVALGDGWYGAESHEGRPLRWLAEEAEFLVILPSNEEAFRVSVDCEPGPSLGRNAWLELCTDEGDVLDRHPLERAGTFDMALDRSRFGSSPVVPLLLRVNNPKPTSFSGPDPRRLAVRVNAITATASAGTPDRVSFTPGWDAETDDGEEVRWLVDYGDIDVEYSGHHRDMALFAHLIPGPCLDLEGNRLQLVRHDGSRIAEMSVRAPGAAVLPIPADSLAVGPSRLTLRIVNPSPRPFAHDDRPLNLQVRSVAFLPLERARVAQAHAQQSFADDVPRTGPAAQGLHFQNGWYPPEHHEGETFRWMGDRAELFVPGDPHTPIVLDLRAGPDLDIDHRVVVERLDGTHIADCDLHSGRSPLVLPQSDLDEVIVVRCGLSNADRSQREDPRLLALRVVGISATGAPPNLHEQETRA